MTFVCSDLDNYLKFPIKHQEIEEKFEGNSDSRNLQPKS